MLLSVSVHFFVLILSGILLLVFLLIVCVIIYGIFQYQKSVRTSGWSEIINRKISEVIVYDDQDQPTDNEFRRFSERSSFRNLFLQKLVDSEKKFSGAAKDKLKNLFDQHGLDREAEKKLNQKKTFLIAGGIQELTVLGSDDAIPKISRFLSHPSVQVYQEAQYAMVRLKGFEGLGFLDTAEGRISEWQQLRLLLSVTRIPEDSDEAIEKWLSSPNATVVAFTLKLLRKFQLLSFYPLVVKLLEHPSPEVRKQGVQTLLSLENPFTTGALMEAYPVQPLDVQLEILRAMKVLKDKAVTGMLKKELSENPVAGVKVLAAEALFALGEQESLARLINNETASDELIQIVKYALREKIC